MITLAIFWRIQNAEIESRKQSIIFVGKQRARSDLPSVISSWWLEVLRLGQVKGNILNSDLALSRLIRELMWFNWMFFRSASPENCWNEKLFITVVWVNAWVCVCVSLRVNLIYFFLIMLTWILGFKFLPLQVFGFVFSLRRSMMDHTW